MHLRTHNEKYLWQRVITFPISISNDVTVFFQLLEAFFDRNITMKLVAKVIELLFIAFELLFQESKGVRGIYCETKLLQI